MRNSLYFTTGFLCVSLLILLSFGCRKDDQTGEVYLYFDHEIDGKAVELHDKWYNYSGGHPFQVSRMKYYVSDFALIREDGSRFEEKQVHYRDIEDDATKSYRIKEVPEGEYTSISFIFGLDEVTNVDGGLPNTTTNINMEWPIPGDQGYHYMKFEGRYDSLATGVIKNFNLHTGAAKGNQNFIRMTLPLHHPMNLKNGTWGVHLTMNLKEWLENPQVYDFSTFGSMIMDNQAAQAVLKANGVDVFTVSAVEKE